MNSLILNNKPYPSEWLINTPERINWADLTPDEAHTLKFCRQWLSGQESFTLRTSGSTGQPKTITLDRAQMAASARLTGEALGLQPGDHALVCLSTQYVAGKMMLVRGFELGLKLTIVNPSRTPLAGFPGQTHFDFTALVPLQLQQTLTDSVGKLPILNGMKAILVGGAPVNVAQLEQLQIVTAPIYHTYGMTETATHVALKRLNGPEPDDAFTPLPGVEVGLDQRGCLTVQSTVTNGQTLYTNDRVELRPDGSFIWLGRIDNVINSGGVKVQIEKVESALAKLFYHFGDGSLAQRRFFVGPVDDDKLGQVVAAVIEGEPFSAEMKTKLRTELLNALTKYEVPRHFYLASHLEETPTGKIDRAANLKRIRQRLQEMRN